MVPTSYVCSGVNAICLHRCVGCHLVWRGTDPQPMSGAEIHGSDRRWRERVGADKNDASISTVFLENSLLLSAPCWGRCGLCRAEKERDSPGSQRCQCLGNKTLPQAMVLRKDK